MISDKFVKTENVLSPFRVQYLELLTRKLLRVILAIIYNGNTVKQVIFIISRTVIAFAAIYEGVFVLVGHSSFFKRFQRNIRPADWQDK